MNKDGFASMYLVYSFFLVFIIMMLSVLMINQYKKTFLTALKNDIKDEVQEYYLDVVEDNLTDIPLEITE